MTNFLYGLALGIALTTITTAYASRTPQASFRVDAAQYNNLVGDLRHFQDFHKSLLILCDRKKSDAMCIPKPKVKPR
jgi:hypothetical protein